MSRTAADDYYIKAFKKLESKGKDSWNWAAAIFGSVWFLYRKMYLYVFLASVFQICVLLSVKAVTETYAELGKWLEYGVYAVEILFFGYYGNRLYYRTVKKRIAAGYHLLDNYHPFSVSSAVISTVIYIIYVMALANLPEGASSKGILFDIAVIALVAIYAFADWIASPDGKVSDTEISEKNIRQYLVYSKKNHFPGRVATVFAVLVGVIICCMVVTGYSIKVRKYKNLASVEKLKISAKSEAPSIPAKKIEENTSGKK